MDKVVVKELKAQGCGICQRFEEFWKSIEKDWPNVEFLEIDMVTPEGQELIQKYQIFASPGIIINNELFQYGGFDKEKFIQKLKELS